MDGTKNKQIARGFKEARAITKKWAKSFYFASLFLPRKKRHASYAVYAICRGCDHSVDDTTDHSKAQSLSEMKQKIDLVYGASPLGQDLFMAFRETVRTYQVPKQYFDDLIDGLSMDLNKSRYKNFQELYAYCYKVAGVVGLIMLKILGYAQKEAEDHAVSLGIAMQLTNILRDVKEDYFLGRIYLPKEELAIYGLSEDVIAQERLDGNFKDFLVSQIARARGFYQESSKGIGMIANRRSRFVVCVMKDLYSGILTAIECNHYDIFKKRAHLSKAEKIFQALKILLRGRYLWK